MPFWRLNKSRKIQEKYITPYLRVSTHLTHKIPSGTWRDCRLNTVSSFLHDFIGVQSSTIFLSNVVVIPVNSEKIPRLNRLESTWATSSDLKWLESSQTWNEVILRSRDSTFGVAATLPYAQLQPPADGPCDSALPFLETTASCAKPWPKRLISPELGYCATMLRKPVPAARDVPSGDINSRHLPGTRVLYPQLNSIQPSCLPFDHRLALVVV
jgi:hypothetical protein